jgi:hypothetical protein
LPESKNDSACDYLDLRRLDAMVSGFIDRLSLPMSA